MRQGMFPGQQQMLIEYARIGLEAESGFRRTRRRFLATLAIAIPAALAGGVAAGHAWAKRSGTEQPPAIDAVVLSRLQWARRLAAGPDEALLVSSATFLLVLDRCGGDEELWRGFERLAHLAMASTDPDRRALAVRLLASCSAQALPQRLESLPARLRAHAQPR